MLPRLVLLALALLAAPTVAAQDAFGFTDAALDASPPAMNAYADLVSGSLAKVDDATLRATMGLTALPETQPGLGIGFLFMAGEEEWYVALVHQETLVYYYGRWVDELPASASDTVGSYTTGPGAQVVVDFPLSAIPNVTEIAAPRGLVADFKALLLPTGGPMVVHDEARGEGTLVVREPTAEPDAAETTPGPAQAPAPGPGTPSPDAPSPIARAETTRETPLPPTLVALAVALAALARIGRHESP